MQIINLYQKNRRAFEHARVQRLVYIRIVQVQKKKRNIIIYIVLAMTNKTRQYVCVQIPLILLKTENNKKSFSVYCSLLKLLFTCLFVLFISHEQCNRRWFKKKKNKMPETPGAQNKQICLYMAQQIKMIKTKYASMDICLFFVFELNFLNADKNKVFLSTNDILLFTSNQR